jgi:hypothetical protein
MPDSGCSSSVSKCTFFFPVRVLARASLLARSTTDGNAQVSLSTLCAWQNTQIRQFNDMADSIEEQAKTLPMYTSEQLRTARATP